MKVLSITLLLSLVSCASRAPLSYNQKCAMKGMVLSGVTSQSGSTSGSAYSYQTGQTLNSYGSYSGEAVSCEVPKTEKQQCEANEYASSAKPVLEYNESADNIHFWNGLGYVAYVVPGVIMKITYDDKKEKAVKQADQLEATVVTKCGSTRDVASQK